jgi:hypothetical protein
MSNSDKKTDDSKLVATDTVYVSPDGGTTDEAFPKKTSNTTFALETILTAPHPQTRNIITQQGIRDDISILRFHL